MGKESSPVDPGTEQESLEVEYRKRLAKRLTAFLKEHGGGSPAALSERIILLILQSLELQDTSARERLLEFFQRGALRRMPQKPPNFTFEQLGHFSVNDDLAIESVLSAFEEKLQTFIDYLERKMQKKISSVTSAYGRNIHDTTFAYALSGRKIGSFKTSYMIPVDALVRDFFSTKDIRVRTSTADFSGLEDEF